MRELSTIGHSIYNADFFVSKLRENHIDTVVDVRSVPYSRYASQYNRGALKEYLKKNGIIYIYMGDLLGARYDDRELLFDDGKVNFRKVQETKPFQDGVTRLDNGIKKGYSISLMCSEKEAFDCHRFGLISQFLREVGVEVKHIYPDGVIAQQELEKRLLHKYRDRLPEVDLFNPDVTYDMRLKLAYELRNRDIAYEATAKG
ncbi:MAG: DUF488 domain-containing protein [Epsilonproteobacteria bacterium]|nr:DUF488 domain-containing protein [Campylobacterota bacterium]